MGVQRRVAPVPGSFLVNLSISNHCPEVTSGCETDWLPDGGINIISTVGLKDDNLRDAASICNHDGLLLLTKILYQ